MSLCKIDLGAIARNFAALPKPVMAVVKHDAYGHGLVPVARTLARAGCDRFCVADAAEARKLQAAGIGGEIMLLAECLAPADWEIAAGLTTLVASPEALAAYEAAGCPKARVALKIDTGMHRLGFAAEETGQVARRLAGYPDLRVCCLMSHLASAGQDPDYTRWQLGRFAAALAMARSVFPDIQASLANSQGLALGISGQTGRAGYALYAPVQGLTGEAAMSLAGRVVAVKTVPRGARVSYGGAWQAPETAQVAIVATGYAHGLPRQASGRIFAGIGQRRAPQVGAICMGMSAVAAPCRVGDLAWWIGGPAKITIEELASAAGTIPYALMCQIGQANPRTYVETLGQAQTGEKC